jgi:hypothetical protein
MKSLRLKLSVLSAVLGLSACASQPSPPDWLLQSEAAMQQHARSWFEGRDKLAEKQLNIAREAVSRTGDATQMGRVELHACAVHLASLARSGCPGFDPLAQDAAAAERAYANYLAGQLTAVDVHLLPKMQREVWQASDASTNQVLAAIADPLSRLLAAAVLLQSGRLSPKGISIAIETAAQQGWRRPLLTWLGLEQQRLEKLGELEAAAAVERRIARVNSGFK